jgi:hypothetical protein
MQLNVFWSQGIDGKEFSRNMLRGFYGYESYKAKYLPEPDCIEFILMGLRSALRLLDRSSPLRESSGLDHIPFHKFLF